VEYLTLYPKYLDKKIDKLVKKVFKKEDSLSLKPFNLPVEFRDQSHIELFTITKDSTKRGFVAVTLANGCEEGGCSAADLGEDNEFTDKYEQYYFATVFDVKGKILRVKVIEYDSDYGYEIMSRGWLKQFTSSKNDEFIYGKNIDAIAGATVTGESIVSEVNILRMIMGSVSQELTP
jgi:Na+-translocating ferredoxin:NAD+ oxidoreductase RnfG subunit